MSNTITTPVTAAVEVPMIFDVDQVAQWLTSQRNLTADTFVTAVVRTGRVHAPWLLAQAVLAGAFGDPKSTFPLHDPALAEQAKATAEAWSDCDFPSQALSPENWTALFQVAGYTVDGDFAELPEEPIRLYRGSTEPGKHGMAWTSNPSTARFFATEYSKRPADGEIWTAVFKPEHLLAQINWREQREYVVDPEVLASGLVEAEKYTPAD